MNRRAFIKGLVALPFVGAALAKTAWAQHHLPSLSEIITATVQARGKQISDNIMMHNALLQRLDQAEVTIKARLDPMVEDIFSKGTQKGAEGGLGDLLK